MTIDSAFTTLLAEIKLALQNSLARSNAATEAGNFDLVELELERQRNLVSLRNQLQAIQEAWPDVVGELQHNQAEIQSSDIDKFSGYKKIQGSKIQEPIEETKLIEAVVEVSDKTAQSPSGRTIFARYKRHRYEAMLLPNYQVRYNGKLFHSPSGAATAITNTNVNGWRFWHYIDERGQKRLIDDLRRTSEMR